MILSSPPARLSTLELHPYNLAHHLYLYALILLQHLIILVMKHLMLDSVVASELVAYNQSQLRQDPQIFSELSQHSQLHFQILGDIDFDAVSASRGVQLVDP